jgi:class 3 adenylate cyclase
LELRPAEDATYATPDPYLRASKSELPAPDGLGNLDAATLLHECIEGRLVVPFFELTACRVEAKKAQQITMTMPASEWLCRFSRSIVPGAIAALANTATRTSAWLETRQNQSFVGLAQSVCFYRPIPADGRIVRVHSVGTVYSTGVITAGVEVHDGEGAVVASGQGIGQVVDASKRQKRRASESKRILATLLFTDIVGSTQHAERLGDARWRALLTEHRNAARAEILRCEGVEIDTAGDGFFVRFDSPARALDCARAVRDGVKRLGIEVRLGVHTGECEQQGRTLTGMAVHIAARIQTLAAPGEILVSNTVKDLVVGSGLRFQDRGQHALKGVPDEWHLFALA